MSKLLRAVLIVLSISLVLSAQDTDLNAVSQIIQKYNSNPQDVIQLLEYAMLPEPNCTGINEFVPGRSEYREAVLEKFFEQRLPELLAGKLPTDRIKMVIATTWKRVCGIAYYVRQMITTIEQLMPDCLEIDIAEIILDQQPYDSREWPNKRVIGQATANSAIEVYELGKVIAEGNYDVIILENEHFLQDLEVLDRFIDGIDYKNEGLARKSVLVTLHSVYVEPKIVQQIKQISTKIAHFLQLFDYECLFFINHIGIERERCVSVNDAALGKGYRNREMLKQYLGLSGRKVVFNYGIMGDHKAPNVMATGVQNAALLQHPEVLFLGVGIGAERYEYNYRNSPNVLFIGTTLSNEMIELLASAADIFIMGNAEMPCTLFVSGTLTYGFNKGLPLISTELLYSQFLIRNEEVGYLVERKQPDPITQAVTTYFNKPQEARQAQYEQLYCKGKLVAWDVIGKEYAALFAIMKLKEDVNQYKENNIQLGKCEDFFRQKLEVQEVQEVQEEQLISQNQIMNVQQQNQTSNEQQTTSVQKNLHSKKNNKKKTRHQANHLRKNQKVNSLYESL